MRSKQFRVLRRVGSLLGCLVATAMLATGCGNDGGAGDGAVDDSGGAPPQAGAHSAGKSGGKAGSATSSAGTGGKAGSSGASGAGGASGSAGASGASGAGGASGSAGASGNGGAAGKAGAGGSSGGNSGGTAGMAAGSGAAGMSAGTGGGGSLTCGNGTIETGETCDVLKSDADYGVLCSNTCYTVGTKACLDCEKAGDCFESVHNCAGPAAKPFTESQVAACFAVMRCIQKSNCLDGTGSLGKCYCGTLDLMKCTAAPFTGAGSPDGACVKEIQAGMPDVTTNTTALGTPNPIRPAGAALARLNCQKVAAVDGVTCADPCGFKAGGPAFP